MIERERIRWELFLKEAGLDQADLYGHAASSAAIELVENWKDCWKDGYEDGVSSWQEMMVEDIKVTIDLLQRWRASLASTKSESRKEKKLDEPAVLGELHALEDQHEKLLKLFKEVYHRIQSEEIAGHFPVATICELEKLFPYNPNKNALEGRSCPSCGSFKRFDVLGKAWMTVMDDGIEEYVDPEWDDDSKVRCTQCYWLGTWKDLED